MAIINTNLDSPESIIMEKVAEATSDIPNKNIYYLFPCYDLSPQNPIMLNTRPQSITVSTIK